MLSSVEIRNIYIYSIAWGYPALPGLLKVTPAVYPHSNDFTGKLNLRYLSPPIQLRILKLIYEHSCRSLEFSNQNLGQIGPGVPELRSDKQTDTQTNRDYNFIYIDSKIKLIHL